MVSEVEVKELKRTIRLVARNLGTHHITGPEEYFERFHSELGLPPSVLGDARALEQCTRRPILAGQKTVRNCRCNPLLRVSK